MTHSQGEIESNRRKVLKGLGVGAMTLPLVSERAVARQGDCNLTVSVEPGEGTAENWTPRSRITDEFKGRVDVSGFSATHLAYMMAVVDPDSKLVQTRSGTFQVDPNWTSAYVVHNRTWNPGGIGPIGRWQNGTYRLVGVAVDDQGNFGGATSPSFQITR